MVIHATMNLYNISRINLIIIIFLLIGSFTSAPLVMADSHALIIGIDKYNTIGSLDGAVNDARDIADALRTAGVKDLTTLLDEQVTKKSVMDEWNGMLKRSSSGDTVFFTYAGHGGEEPEHVKGSEKTGKDQNLLFPRFDSRTPYNAERLVDNEIALMVKQAADANISVVMVMDACHSGTMTRGVDTRVRKFKVRAVKVPPIKDDHLDPIDPSAAYINFGDQKELLYFGAVQDNELAPEIEIDGKPHGALSASLARGLKGAADMNRNGVITADELETYVHNTVLTMMEGQQHPSLMRGSEILLAVPINAHTPSSSILPVESQDIAIQIINSDKVPVANYMARLKGVVFSKNPGTAVLTWDVRRGHILNKLGDIVAYANERAVTIPPPPSARGFGRGSPPAAGTSPVEMASASSSNGLSDIEAVQKIVDKWRLVEEIGQYALRDPLNITLQPNDQLHQNGDKVVLNISGQSHAYFTLFNLGSDGTVNFLYPLTNGQYHDPLEIPTGREYQLDLTVQPPFGGDHFIAISSNEPLHELHQDLVSLDGKQAARELSVSFRRDIEGKILQIGVYGVYTTPKR
ncbi:metacaspase-1 [Gammaproteobacteria bacterium]